MLTPGDTWPWCSGTGTKRQVWNAFFIRRTGRACCCALCLPSLAASGAHQTPADRRPQKHARSNRRCEVEREVAVRRSSMRSFHLVLFMVPRRSARAHVASIPWHRHIFDRHAHALVIVMTSQRYRRWYYLAYRNRRTSTRARGAILLLA